MSRAVLRGIWIWWVLVASFILLTVAVAAGWKPLSVVDNWMADQGYHATYGHSRLSQWWLAVALYGQPMVLRGALAVAALDQWRRRFPARALWLVAVVLAETVIGPSAKLLLSRPRPQWLAPIAVEHSTSYPSGHATAAGMLIATAPLTVASVFP